MSQINWESFEKASEAHCRREKQKARELRQSVWWRQQLGRRQCYHCEKQFVAEELTMDHLIPIVRGGVTNKKNVVVSCKECNSKKKYWTRAELALQEVSSQISDISEEK